MENIKAVLLLICFYGVVTDGIRCFSRSEKNLLGEEQTKMNCDEPMMHLVNIPVPQGFHYVVPSMVKVRRCHGLMCWGKNMQCLPTKASKTRVKVEAKSRDGMKINCTHVLVEEHDHCQCGCSVSKKDCNDNQVFDGRMCECVCDPEKKAACSATDGTFMWDDSTCSCVCLTILQCPEGAMWIEETCSCMRMMSMSGD